MTRDKFLTTQALVEGVFTELNALLLAGDIGYDKAAVNLTSVVNSLMLILAQEVEPDPQPTYTVGGYL